MESSNEASNHSSSDTSDTFSEVGMEYEFSPFVDDSRSDQESDHEAEVQPFIYEPLTANSSDTDPEDKIVILVKMILPGCWIWIGNMFCKLCWFKSMLYILRCVGVHVAIA